MEFIKIDTKHPLYPQEQALRNEVLLRPIGVPDHAWEMHDSNSFHFVAVENDKVIACVVLRPLIQNNDGQHSAQLMQMAVKPTIQTKGIGRLLVDKLLLFAKNEGFSKVICHSRNNVVGFYEKLGFEVYDEPFVEVGIKHRHMKIDLA